jgi:hypothetical protein
MLFAGKRAEGLRRVRAALLPASSKELVGWLLKSPQAISAK